MSTFDGLDKVFGEEPTEQVFIGGAIIIFGIGMKLFSKPKK